MERFSKNEFSTKNFGTKLNSLKPILMGLPSSFLLRNMSLNIQKIQFQKLFLESSDYQDFHARIH